MTVTVTDYGSCVVVEGLRPAEIANGLVIATIGAINEGRWRKTDTARVAASILNANCHAARVVLP